MDKKELPVLETERLVLRQFNDDDAPALYEYAKAYSVGVNAGWKPHESVEESREIIKMFSTMTAVWAIIDKANGKLMGSVGLSDKKRFDDVDCDLEIGYALGCDYWGKGIMTEAVKRIITYAFDEMNVDTLFVSHFIFNMRSKRVIEKCGFVYQGRKENSWTNFDGKVLSEDWYLLKKSESKN